MLVNERGVQCMPVVWARPLSPGPVRLGARAFLKGVRVASLDEERAADHGPGLVAFVLDDPMDIRDFEPGEKVTLEER